MSTGVYVALAAVALALAFGLWRAGTDGRFRGTHGVAAGGATSASEQRSEDGSLLTGTPWADGLGERATLLQFSSAFCAPCRATRRILADVAEVTPGVVHLEVDAEQHLDVVRRLGITRTPTTVILDATGRELTRASGAPAKEQVYVALASSLDPD